MSNEYIAGSVLSVLRYPVKSMMGEELTAADVRESGLIGDRGYALIDNSTGKIASAKNPRIRTNARAGLSSCAAG
jgi:uncharacterized protein